MENREINEKKMNKQMQRLERYFMAARLESERQHAPLLSHEEVSLIVRESARTLMSVEHTHQIHHVHRVHHTSVISLPQSWGVLHYVLVCMCVCAVGVSIWLYSVGMLSPTPMSLPTVLKTDTLCLAPTPPIMRMHEADDTLRWLPRHTFHDVQFRHEMIEHVHRNGTNVIHTNATQTNAIPVNVEPNQEP